MVECGVKASVQLAPTPNRRIPKEDAMAAKTVAERFEEKVDRSGGPDACHPWTAK